MNSLKYKEREWAVLCKTVKDITLHVKEVMEQSKRMLEEEWSGSGPEGRVQRA